MSKHLQRYCLAGISIWALLGTGWMMMRPIQEMQGAQAVKRTGHVTFAYISATKISQDMVLLQWETTQEKDHQRFVIERALAGDQFDSIAYIGGAINSSRSMNYQYTDNFLADHAYYRLKNVSLSGQISFSERISIQQPDQQAEMSDFSVSPQFFQDKVNIVFNNLEGGEYRFVLYSREGKEVFGQSLTAAPGPNNFVFEDTVHLSKGTYIATLESSTGFLKVIELVKE